MLCSKVLLRIEIVPLTVSSWSVIVSFLENMNEYILLLKLEHYGIELQQRWSLFSGDALNTDKTGKEVKDLRDSLVQFYGIQKKEREASFEVVVILTNLTQQSHEDSAISVRQLFSEQGSPFLSISCEKAMKIQVIYF